MNARPSTQEAPPVLDVQQPGGAALPIVFASPHSGTYYPDDLVTSSALDPVTLRRSEDAFVDRLFADAPVHGCTLLRCQFARVYIDVNREPYELDPSMFEDDLPPYINTTSLRVAGGLGTIARMVADGAEVYRGKLRFEDADARVRRVYHPYHRALQGLLEAAHKRFGFAILVDCHSMPSIGGPLDRDDGRHRPDIVLGDRFGTSCAPALSEVAHRCFSRLGYRVARNNPYAGGFTTNNYGRPMKGVHALQIEINRSLYMDQARIEPLPGFEAVRQHVSAFVRALTELSPEPFLPAC